MPDGAREAVAHPPHLAGQVAARHLVIDGRDWIVEEEPPERDLFVRGRYCRPAGCCGEGRASQGNDGAVAPVAPGSNLRPACSSRPTPSLCREGRTRARRRASRRK